MKLLKVFKKGLISPYKNMKYKKNKVYTCTDFCDDKNIDCAKGYYATDWDGLSYAYRKGMDVYYVEVSGRKVEFNQFKRRYEKIEILDKLTLQEIKEGLKKNSKKAGYDLYGASFPYNPLSKKVNPIKNDIENLKKWASVYDSVHDSVRDSVWASVWDSIVDSVGASVGTSVYDSVWDSVGASVHDFVGNSVRASVGAYISSLFSNVKKWKYIQHEEGENPFQSCIDLWNNNLVPSFDGKTWRLHSGKNAEVVYEWNK